MRPLRDMPTIQIEITNACINRCSNCTRFCGHHRKPFMMTCEEFQRAVDSLEGYGGIVGVMGGEPLLHPEFERFCDYLRSRVPPERCGLWSTFPKGYERYAKLITEVFGVVLLNDHTRPDIRHMPLFLLPRDYLADEDIWYAVHHCRIQNCWSASITPKGAYFCEVAASLDMLLGLNRGWPVEPGWWKRCPNHYLDQMGEFCMKCGASLFCTGRIDTEQIDDVSPGWLEALKELGSPKIAEGRYRLFNGEMFAEPERINEFRKVDDGYQRKVAAKYGISLVSQETGYFKPVLSAR